MAILCCCPLRYSRKFPGEGETCEAHQVQELPVRPPPAKLPPPVAHGVAVSPQSTAARSSLTNPLPGVAGEASIHLAELVIEDSDEDIGDDGLAQTNRNRSTSTLDAVKARIRRHLSQDSMSRQSETEEQIARRAEVKRLMRLRIQEEIQTEGHPGLNADCASQRPASPSVSSATMLGNGPRDTLEFTVDEVKKAAELARTKAADLSNSSEENEQHLSRALSKRSSAHSYDRANSQPHSRPASLCDWMDHTSRAAHTDHQGHVRQRSSLPKIPVSPQLHPVRAGSSHDAASLASWRLSLSADKLADLLTPDKSHSFFRPVASPTASCDTLDARPPVDFLLSNSSCRLPDGHMEHVKRIRRMSSPLGALSSNTANKPNPSQVSLHSHYRRKRIPKSNSLVRDESPVGLWLRTQNQQFRLSTASPAQSDHSTDTESAGPAQDREREMQSKSQSTGLVGVGSARRLSTDRAVIKSVSQGHSPSSVYLAATQKTTTADGGTDIQVGARKGFAGMRLPSFKWHNSVIKGQDQHQPAPPPKHRDSSTPSLVHTHTRHTTLEAGSETSSFFRREAELRAVEERFRDSHLRKKELSIPVESKFHEVLSDNPRFASRHSLLSRLELALPMDGAILMDSFDDNGPEQDHSSSEGRKSGTRQSTLLSTDCQGHLKVPSAEYNKKKSASKRSRFSNHSDAFPRSRGFSSSKDGDETAEMWKRALKAESVSKSPRRSTSSQAVIEAGNAEQNPRAPCPSAVDGRSGSNSQEHSPTCTEPLPQEDEDEFRQSLMRSNMILEDWGRQLGAQEGNTRKQTHTLSSGLRSTYKVSKIPPASWARFPSHNREERNGAAGEADSVKPRDFAVKEVSAAGSITWTTDKEHEGGPTHKSIVRSVSDKFTQPFKSRWSKLLPGRLGASVKDSSIRGARRSSIQGSGDLEYPELELLPTAGGYKELLALEREINEMKGLVDPKTGRATDHAVGSENRSSLVEKMTGVLQTDGSADLDLSLSKDGPNCMNAQEILVKIRVPATPATENKQFGSVHGNDMTGSSGERYATPRTHFSVSRPLTPQSTTHLPLTPGSIQSTASVIRHTSLCVPKKTSDLSIPVSRSELCNDRSSSRRRSAPPITPGSD